MYYLSSATMPAGGGESKTWSTSFLLEGSVLQMPALLQTSMLSVSQAADSEPGTLVALFPLCLIRPCPHEPPGASPTFEDPLKQRCRLPAPQGLPRHHVTQLKEKAAL